MSRAVVVPVLQLERREVEVVYAALDALTRECERVAPSRLRVIRPLMADVLAFLTEPLPAGSDPATGDVRIPPEVRTMVSPPMVAPFRDGEDPVTVAEAARRAGLSVAYVRRRASVIGHRVGHQWVIPVDRLHELRKGKDTTK